MTQIDLSSLPNNLILQIFEVLPLDKLKSLVEIFPALKEVYNQEEFWERRYLELSRSKQPPEYVVYYRNGPRKALMVLKPRSQEVIYTPYALQKLNLNPRQLPPYALATNIVHQAGNSMVPLYYEKGRPTEEITRLIDLTPPLQRYKIQDLPDAPLYKGQYGKYDPVEKKLDPLLSCQESTVINLNASYPGGVFYSKMAPILKESGGGPISGLIMGKNDAYIIDSSVSFEQILADINKCGRVHYLITSIYGVFDMSNPKDREGHALALSIDPNTRENSGLPFQEIELIDPQGITPYTHHIYYWVNQLIKYLNVRGNRYQRLISADTLYCPQGISIFAKQMSNEGQCLIWTYWYLWLRINNPNVPSEAIRLYINEMSPDQAFDRIRMVASHVLG